MADGLLTTGEFARRSRLSIKALRLYDRSGLLRPTEVEAANGYRRYSERQLYAARLIVLLRRLDMPLSQVAEIVATAGPEAAGLLARYWTDVERRLAAQRELADRLVRNLTGETRAPAGEWPVAQRDVPEQLVLTEQRYVTAAELPWIHEATTRLTAMAEATGPRFVIFHGEVTEDGDGPVEVCVPIDPATADPATMPVRREPAHREAYIPVERGHFEPPQILSIYDAAHAWVRDHGLLQTAPAREVYGYPTGELICDVAVPFR
ncbi:MAG: MerR family transcriptional regulator [Actinoplanes sp.]